MANADIPGKGSPVPGHSSPHPGQPLFKSTPHISNSIGNHAGISPKTSAERQLEQVRHGGQKTPGEKQLERQRGVDPRDGD